MTLAINPTLASISKGRKSPNDCLSPCSELLYREVCSFHRAVAEKFGITEAARSVDDWLELLEDLKEDERDAALVARHATIHAADRLASRVCDGHVPLFPKRTQAT